MQENLISLKKLIASNNADNPFIITFQDFTVALAVKLLHRNPAFDNNTEFNSIKHNLMVSAQEHYLKTKSLTQAKSNEITNFCQTGIIGRVSCIEQDAQFHLDLNKIDILNGQPYYDLEAASSNYASFLKVINETPQFIREQHEQQLKAKNNKT